MSFCQSFASPADVGAGHAGTLVGKALDHVDVPQLKSRERSPRSRTYVITAIQLGSGRDPITARGQKPIEPVRSRRTTVLEGVTLSSRH